MQTTSLKFLSMAGAVLFGLAATLSAQNADLAPPRPAGVGVGLIGATYVGTEFGYTRHVDGGPRALRTYGFVYNQPLPEGLDFNFNYRDANASEAGIGTRLQQFYVGLTGHRTLGWGKVFLQGNTGWAWAKTGGVQENGFAYELKTGAQFQLLPQLVLTPYVSYEAAPRLHTHEWNYGVLTNYRFNREWSATVGAKLDEEHNVSYSVGVNFHF